MPAYASDYSGAPTMIGIPVLIVTLVAFGITSIYPASKTRKTVLGIVATPLLLGKV